MSAFERATRRLQRTWRNLTPPAIFVWSFGLLILLGTAGLLVLPGLHVGERLSPLDALFTMTSAVCVTGLNVVDPATRFTFWGQLWILVFIQAGGFGLVTLTTLIIGALGLRLSLRSEVIAGSAVQGVQRRDVRQLVGATARFTFVIEAAGAVLLFPALLLREPPARAAWHAVFHSVSAFCNAGFSTFPASLTGFARDPYVLVVITLLVVLGGIGYLSSEELLRFWRRGGTRGPVRISAHTFSALWVTGLLLGAGFVLFAAFEWNGVLGGLSLVEKLANALFMSAMPRTAGFNAVDYTATSNATAFLTVLLMFVGGSPGSTAGGIKTTTVAVLAALAVARINGRRHAQLHDRSVPEGTVERTISLVLIAAGVLAAGLFLLSVAESGGGGAEARQRFLPLLFESMSAFATVGLSMDLTPTLSPAGRAIVIALMFVGRVGPLAFFAALSVRSALTSREYRLAREDVIIG